MKYKGVRFRGCFPKVLVNDILVGLERIMDYTGVGLERFNCIVMIMYLSMLSPYSPSGIGIRCGLDNLQKRKPHYWG